MVSRLEEEGETANFIPGPEDYGKRKLEGSSRAKWGDAYFRAPLSGLYPREGEVHPMNDGSTEGKI